MRSRQGRCARHQPAAVRCPVSDLEIRAVLAELEAKDLVERVINADGSVGYRTTNPHTPQEDQ